MMNTGLISYSPKSGITRNFLDLCGCSSKPSHKGTKTQSDDSATLVSLCLFVRIIWGYLNRPHRSNFSIVFAFLAVLLLPAAATEARAQGPSADDGFSAGDILVYPVRFYQKYLSGADGDRCPMHPSCSSYAVQAVKKHGPLIGYFMACDRLMRCGRDEKYIGQPVMKDGKQKIYDPVSNNDFWWYDNKAAGKKGMEEKAAEEKGAEK